MAFNRCLICLCMGHKMIAFKPPETATIFNVPWNQEDSDRNPQLRCEFIAMSIIITVSIVKGHHKWSALIMLAPFTFVRCVQFFQCRLEMEYSIVTVKVEQVPSQVSSCC